MPSPRHQRRHLLSRTRRLSRSGQGRSARRLLEAVDPLITELLRLALDDDTEPSVKLRAIRDALDRAGLKAPKQVEVVTLDAIDAEIRRLERELAPEAEGP